ncbi:MAG: Gfo/Idh/MocA family oxidoreductase [Eubacteriales bacterium]|nr:Gfo/Idh/MocA family oxidoreductase [Eubacteriales bacterium]
MIFQTGTTLRLGVVGLGCRGTSQLGVLLDMEDVTVTAVCDVYEDRVQAACAKVREAKGTLPFGCEDYHKLLERKDVDAVIIMTSWTTHIRIAVDAMNAGYPVAMEVGGASSLEECWQLVRTQEKTGLPCMMLENCCYGRDEMQVLNMVKKGLFGEILHCQGGYHHDLRDEVGNGDINRHYRQENFLHRNGELYPTHELGPISKVLELNRGNRMVRLTSMASKARGMHLWMQKNRPDHALAQAAFREGDVVTTMIQCANGETIVLTHDCSSPRPYSRGGLVQGTNGIWMEDNASVFISGLSPERENYWAPEIWEPFSNYRAQYDHPLWKAYENYGLRGGHDGMDFLVLRAFVESVQNGTPTPIDVYDTAAWMAVTSLSEQSIALGSAAVDVPDFTNGRWIGREALPESVYALDAVHDHLFND